MSIGPHAVIAESVARNFGALKCSECSIALLETFARRGVIGRRIQLTAKNVGRRAWIVMKDHSFQLPFPLNFGETAISLNGTHYGLEVEGFVYDNIFRTGIATDLWPKQFECISSRFEITYPEDV